MVEVEDGCGGGPGEMESLGAVLMERYTREDGQVEMERWGCNGW